MGDSMSPPDPDVGSPSVSPFQPFCANQLDLQRDHLIYEQQLASDNMSPSDPDVGSSTVPSLRPFCANQLDFGGGDGEKLFRFVHGRSGAGVHCPTETRGMRAKGKRVKEKGCLKPGVRGTPAPMKEDLGSLEHFFGTGVLRQEHESLPFDLSKVSIDSIGCLGGQPPTVAPEQSGVVEVENVQSPTGTNRDLESDDEFFDARSVASEDGMPTGKDSIVTTTRGQTMFSKEIWGIILGEVRFSPH